MLDHNDVRKYNDLVVGPGRFEGEMPWVPYYWDMTLNGDGESFYSSADDCDAYDLFNITVEERDAFMFPACDTVAVIHGDSQGFVRGWTFADREEAMTFIYREFEARYGMTLEASYDAENDDRTRQRSTSDD